MNKDVFESVYKKITLRLRENGPVESMEELTDVINSIKAELLSLPEPVFGAVLDSGDEIEFIYHQPVPQHLHQVWTNRIQKMVTERMSD
jgi:hypothetical protein